MKYVITLFVLGMSLSALAQRTIKPEEIKSHIGDSVKLATKIFGGKHFTSGASPVTLLDVGGKYPDALLTLVIYDDIRGQFSTPPEELFKDKDASITGKIEMYKGKPEIIIHSSAQLTVAAQ